MNMKTNYEQTLAVRLKNVSGDMSKVWLPEKEIHEMTNEEIRNYVTFFTECSYHMTMNPYELKKQIIDQLNDAWNERVGADFTRIYNFLDEKKNKGEKWNGDERYKMFSYAFKGYGEFSVLKETKATLTFLKEKGISVDVYFELMELNNLFWFWEMGKEREMDTHYMDSKNKVYQDEFVNYVLGELEEDQAKMKPWFTQKFEEPKDQ